MSYRLTTCVALAALSCACIAELEPDVGPLAVSECDPSDSNPDVDVSFEADLLPVLMERCGCHDPASPFPFAIASTGFSIGSVDSILAGGQVGGEDTVLPGDPCASVIVQKVGEAPLFGSRMPLFGPYMSDDERALLHDWIAEGAHDD